MKIDTDGMPYWTQLPDTHILYGFNWEQRIGAMTNGAYISAVELSATVSAVYSSAAYTSTIHAFFVTVSGGNVGSNIDFTSTVFLTDGQKDKARFRVKVID